MIFLLFTDNSTTDLGRFINVLTSFVLDFNSKTYANLHFRTDLLFKLIARRISSDEYRLCSPGHQNDHFFLTEVFNFLKLIEIVIFLFLFFSHLSWNLLKFRLIPISSHFRLFQNVKFWKFQINLKNFRKINFRFADLLSSN